MRLLNEKFSVLAALLAGAVGFASLAHASSIGVQFQGNTSNPLPSGETAGFEAVAQDNWNALTGSSTYTDVALSDNNAQPTTALLSSTNQGTYFGGGGQFSSSVDPNAAGDNILAGGELLSAGNNHAIFTVSTVPYADYDVYVYSVPDANGRETSVGLTSSGETFQSFTSDNSAPDWVAATGTWNGSAPAPTGAGADASANYAVFTGITTSSFSIDFYAPGNSGINGIQIVQAVPEPASLGLLVVSGAMLLNRRNRRVNGV
jgi:hypothetical protein